MIDLSYMPTNETCVVHMHDGKDYTVSEDVAWNFLRGQIARWRWEDCTVTFRGVTYKILPNGMVENCPKDLFSLNETLISYMYENSLNSDPSYNESQELWDELEAECGGLVQYEHVIRRDGTVLS